MAGRWVRILLAAFVLVLQGACVTINSLNVPPCPYPQVGTADQLAKLTESEHEYLELVDWISELDRYCNAIDSLQ